MKAVIYRCYGDESVMEFAEVPDPKRGLDRVIVRTKAAGVNPTDYKTREGSMDAIADVVFPVIPGYDLAGVVEAVGYAPSAFQPGDEVMGYIAMDWIHHGTYAELVPAPNRTLIRKPAALGWAEAAALPVAGLTAFQAVLLAGVSAGDVVLVHGASGGVGSLTVQIAAILGAQVIGTSSAENHEFVAKLGAQPVAYGGTLIADVRNLVPRGVDRIVDCVGKGDLAPSLDLLAEGRSASDTSAVADAAGAMRAGSQVVGLHQDTHLLAQLAEWAASGALVVPVEHRFTLAEAAEAHRLSKTGHARGKIVLEVD